MPQPVARGQKTAHWEKDVVTAIAIFVNASFYGAFNCRLFSLYTINLTEPCKLKQRYYLSIRAGTILLFPRQL